MYWLALEEEAVPLTKLRNLLPVPELNLFTALKSLGERSLIEKGSGKFSLQPVVKEYVKNQFVGQVCREINEFNATQDFKRLKLLRTHLLNPLTDREKSQNEQAQSILTLSKERLLTARESRLSSSVIEQLENIINKLDQNALQDLGYAKTNLKHLLNELKGN
jgi:hypothetical protein